MWCKETLELSHTHVGTSATPSLSRWHQRRPTLPFPWSGHSCPQCSAVWLWGRLSGGSVRKDENVTQLHKLSFFYTHTHTHTHAHTHTLNQSCLSEPDSPGCLGPNVYSSWKKWLPVLISPFCKLMPACYPPANENLAVLHISSSNFDSSRAPRCSVRRFRNKKPGLQVSLNCVIVWRPPDIQKLATEENATVWFRHSYLHQHLSEQRCLSAVRNVRVWVAGTST